MSTQRSVLWRIGKFLPPVPASLSVLKPPVLEPDFDLHGREPALLCQRHHVLARDVLGHPVRSPQEPRLLLGVALPLCTQQLADAAADTAAADLLPLSPARRLQPRPLLLPQDLGLQLAVVVVPGQDVVAFVLRLLVAVVVVGKGAEVGSVVRRGGRR